MNLATNTDSLLVDLPLQDGASQGAAHPERMFVHLPMVHGEMVYI